MKIGGLHLRYCERWIGRHRSWEVTGGPAGMSSGEMTGAQRSHGSRDGERTDSRDVRRWKTEGLSDGCWVGWEEENSRCLS